MAHNEVQNPVPHSTESVEPRREFAPVERTGAGQTFIHQNGSENLHAIGEMSKPTLTDHQHLPNVNWDHNPQGAEQTPPNINLLPPNPAEQPNGTDYIKSRATDGAMKPAPKNEVPAPGSDTIPVPPIPKPIDY